MTTPTICPKMSFPSKKAMKRHIGNKARGYRCRDCGLWHLGERPYIEHESSPSRYITVWPFGATPGVDWPLRKVSLARASTMVFLEEAKWWDKRSLVMNPRRILNESSQGRAYESAAIETHPKFFNGGLTRTEHKPNSKPGILTWGHIGETK